VPDDLTFSMGTHEAVFPIDRRYSRNHLWLKPLEDSPGVSRVGLTAYSIRLLRDVYFLDWSAGTEFPVADRQEIGQIESSKAVSGLYSPGEGTIVQFNEEVLADPSLINTDGYGGGWLFDFRTSATGMDPGEYVKHLGDAWEVAQRTIKKQMTS
jgi:Glycine cleavage system H protein (lipoate-binding)